MNFVNRIDSYIKETGESQNTLAKKIGVSGAALSQYLKGKYPNPETIEPKIEEFFFMNEKSSSVVREPDFVRTSISDEVLATIEYGHISKKICVVYGDAGVGKTKSAERYAQEHKESVLITVSPVFANTLSFLKLLARELRISGGMRKDDVYISCIEKLEGSGKVLVIDEAQHLNQNAIETIRSINNDAKIGIVLLGNHALYSKMFGKGEATYAQLFSRMAMRKLVVTTNIIQDDIKKLFPDLGKEEQKFLYSISHTRWGLRGSVNVFVNAANNGDTSLDGLVAVAKYMGIGV